MKQTVFVVDDDVAIQEALTVLLQTVALDVECYSSAETFLTAYDNRMGCLLLDVRIKGMSGLRLQEIIINKGFFLPIIFISGHADVPMTVRAMKNGAVDFLTKPFNNQYLLETIQDTLHKNLQTQKSMIEKNEVLNRLRTLTPRELEIMSAVTNGQLTKTIASKLNISIHTVELHRSNIMKKIKVKTATELTKLVMQYNIFDEEELI